MKTIDVKDAAAEFDIVLERVQEAPAYSGQRQGRRGYPVHRAV
ncbi:hypothetical protein [Devosia sp.]|nr:hypothetical protein [Devosia sp.]